MADAKNDKAMRFLTATPEAQQALATDPEFEATIIELLGPDGLAQFRALPTADGGHLAAKPNPNTLFAPGVMGSVLSPLGLGGVWWLDLRARKKLDELGLTPDGSGDAGGEFIDVQPVNVDLSYSEFMAMGLAHDWVSIRGCPFDWRRRFSDNVDRVVDLVDTMRADNGDEPVNLVGHSMGGLLIRTALMERPELWNRIGKVAYIGTPHFGSTSIAGYLKGHLWGTEMIAILGLYLSRQTFQSLWGPLSLLPAPKGVYPGSTADDHPCANFDLYQVESYELDFGNEPERAIRLQTILDHVKEHWQRFDRPSQLAELRPAAAATDDRRCRPRITVPPRTRWQVVRTQGQGASQPQVGRRPPRGRRPGPARLRATPGCHHSLCRRRTRRVAEPPGGGRHAVRLAHRSTELVTPARQLPGRGPRRTPRR